jgi:hypothetical protein
MLMNIAVCLWTLSVRCLHDIGCDQVECRETVELSIGPLLLLQVLLGDPSSPGGQGY